MTWLALRAHPFAAPWLVVRDEASPNAEMIQLGAASAVDIVH